MLFYKKLPDIDGKTFHEILFDLNQNHGYEEENQDPPAHDQLSENIT